MKSKFILEYNNRLMYSKTFLRKTILKSILANFFIAKKYKFFCFNLFVKFNKFSSISYFRNYCLINS
jgi:hypothetical protein